jgi:hypothetical protein
MQRRGCFAKMALNNTRPKSDLSQSKLRFFLFFVAWRKLECGSIKCSPPLFIFFVPKNEPTWQHWSATGACNLFWPPLVFHSDFFPSEPQA